MKGLEYGLSIGLRFEHNDIHMINMMCQICIFDTCDGVVRHKEFVSFIGIGSDIPRGLSGVKTLAVAIVHLCHDVITYAGVGSYKDYVSSILTGIGSYIWHWILHLQVQI